MPYVSKEKRKHYYDLTSAIKNSPPEGAGDLNYLISKLVDEYLFRTGVRYDTLNTVAGVLACAQMEVYRRITAPYEDTKIKENGDVFTV